MMGRLRRSLYVGRITEYLLFFAFFAVLAIVLELGICGWRLALLVGKPLWSVGMLRIAARRGGSRPLNRTA